MSTFNFETLKSAWNKLKQNQEKALRTLAPDLINIDAIHIKRMQETNIELAIQFIGFRVAVQNQEKIPEVKKVILNWMKKFSMDVQQVRSDPDILIIKMSKELKIGEAAISVFKRDPKTNKKKSYYKCIGGKKNGRRVANPSDCITVPDFNKSIKMKITKRAKAGQIANSKKRTQLTNITARRIRKANQRVRKARRF